MLGDLAIFYPENIYTDHVLTTPIFVAPMDHDKIPVCCYDTRGILEIGRQGRHKLSDGFGSVGEKGIMLLIVIGKISVKCGHIPISKNISDRFEGNFFVIHF